MRISGGGARGIPLVLPKGDLVRPATDQMRQAVFSSLGELIVGARFVDLFAGSGAYGLEALSRGAAGGIFVEKNAKAVACVRQNLAAVCKSLGRGEQGFTVTQADALTWHGAGANGAVPDLIFVDPPYDLIKEHAPVLFEYFTTLTVAKPEALVLFETPGEVTLTPAGWECFKRLGKGNRQPTVGFYRRIPAAVAG